MFGQRSTVWVPTVVALGLAFASCEERAPGADYDLSGIVRSELVEGSTPTPMEGARVVFTSDTGHVTETVTDDDGRYEMQVFTDVAFGQVRAEAEGFVASDRTVYFDTPQRRIDFVLRPGAE